MVSKDNKDNKKPESKDFNEEYFKLLIQLKVGCVKEGIIRKLKHLFKRAYSYACTKTNKEVLRSIIGEIISEIQRCRTQRELKCDEREDTEEK